ncbi:GNAT family N-acetyltransferase [Chitinophaga polysaccharea]|uniref:GNAT family N-acetyltransferase n=1 Tax=Chitinophaga TaxID=79328 RepID=UPI001455B5AA|nr:MULTISPECIES: GNAT family N-acetyltransferase [Chitinophaga]NLR61627.1 GNAT family N-acetyltransferase [Chitinophaga polysaccharea]NLU93778.1 GNAT family N-acetyltransferase [Chitinophaga sp. Ak27]
MLSLNFTPFPSLSTPRFQLRALALIDTSDVFSLRSDPRVNQFLDRPIATTEADALQFIEMIQGGIANNKWIYWVITSKNDDRLIGTIGLWHIVPELGEAEIGYELQADYFGKGIMQEVLPEVIRYAQEQLQLKRIAALPAIGNERSIKLLERNRFTIDDALRARLEKEDDLANMLVYSLIVP